MNYWRQVKYPHGNLSLNEIIGANGSTNFPDITSNNFEQTIELGLNLEGSESVDDQNKFSFVGDLIHLIIKKDKSLGIIKGVVKNRDGQGLEVRINNDKIIYTDSNR